MRLFSISYSSSQSYIQHTSSSNVVEVDARALWSIIICLELDAGCRGVTCTTQAQPFSLCFSRFVVCVAACVSVCRYCHASAIPRCSFFSQHVL